MSIKLENGIEGRFRITKLNSSTGDITYDTGWFSNLITDYGMNAIAGSNPAIIGAAVGRGNNPESVSDTVLHQLVAKTFDYVEGSQGSQSGSTISPYYARIYTVYRFQKGSVVGNISEVGAISEAAEPNRLFSRTLIKDQSGSPVTITVLDDEILDVAYECRVYPQLSPTIGSATLLGGMYEFKCTPIDIASARMADILTGGLSAENNSGSGIKSGPLGPSPEYDPGGNRELITTTLAKPYTPGDFHLTYLLLVAPGVYTETPINVLVVKPRQRPATIQFAIEISPGFSKPSTVELRLEFTVSWSRRA